MWKLLSKLKCKMAVCCNSKCSLNDTDNDGIVDSITIKNVEEQEVKNPYGLTGKGRKKY